MLQVCLEGDGAAPEESGESILSLYPLPVQEERPFILVLPGGGYHHLARHEGEPVVQWLNSLGIHAGVLKYRTQDIDPSLLIKDVEDALAWVREEPKEWKVRTGQIGLTGFSAGGHLAAITAVTAAAESKPDLLLLGYPVITFEEPYAHAGSRLNLLGVNPVEASLIAYSADRQVDSRTPPAFIWATANDASVPVENSLKFAAALSQSGISFELHIFEEGRHGLGLSAGNKECRQWLQLCAAWLKKHHYVTEGED
ncbi:Acetylxylan esterase [Paenibacillus auburnensis]|uniref:Acetylxylan esterase n=1 Tax=Paenibacillus auburnensis TaxID=2905649 RepID=A0ABN8FYV0_9BACL|nr:alpha/beta hydrolase [Paenibacillus auburnensis]CAH1194934.1 Acetylxylan esterase [Paenibacillus auburnensis]